jgi:hypothetical protein
MKKTRFNPGTDPEVGRAASALWLSSANRAATPGLRDGQSEEGVSAVS